jgi:phosphatidylglycerophosphate synthase
LARDVIILLGASIHMSVVEAGTPLPNLLGKTTTVLQVIYIILILITNSLSFTINLQFLGFIISAFTLVSFLSYAKEWFANLKDHSNE